MNTTRHFFAGIAGTIGSIELSRVDMRISILAGAATFLYMVVAIIAKVREIRRQGRKGPAHAPTGQ